MSDIWDEKPVFFRMGDNLVYSVGEVDDFLEKLKAHYVPIEEKAEKWDVEYQERDALVKLQKIKAIVTTYGPIPEDMISDIEDIVEESVERELRVEKRLRHKLEMELETLFNFTCMDDISAFLKALMVEHRSKKK